MSTTVFYLNSWLKLHSDLWDTEIQEFNFTDHESGKRAEKTIMRDWSSKPLLIHRHMRSRSSIVFPVLDSSGISGIFPSTQSICKLLCIDLVLYLYCEAWCELTLVSESFSWDAIRDCSPETENHAIYRKMMRDYYKFLHLSFENGLEQHWRWVNDDRIFMHKCELSL